MYFILYSNHKNVKGHLNNPQAPKILPCWDWAPILKFLDMPLGPEHVNDFAQFTYMYQYTLKYLFCFGVLFVVVGGERGGGRGMCEWGFSLSWRCMRMSVWQGGLTGNYGVYFHYLINLKQYRKIVIDLILYVYLKFLIDVFIS